MRTLFLVVAVSAGLAWAAAVTTTSHAGSPAFDLDLGGGGPRVAGRPAESPGFLTSAALPVPPNCSRLYWQTLEVRPSGLAHTIAVSITSDAASACNSLVVGVTSCGTTPAAVPATRASGATSLEITNSPENAGSPKVKCDINPADGGVGFGATLPGLVRSPGESLYLPLDRTHTVVCVCDTPATGLTTTECVP